MDKFERKIEQRIYDYLLERGQATAREIIQFTNYPSSKVRDLKKKGKFKVTYTLVSDEQRSKIIDGSELPEAKRKLNENKI